MLKRNIVTWTGGDMQYLPELVPLARQLYREQLKDWRAYWGDLPDADTCRIFKNRAWHDAYATWRAHPRRAANGHFAPKHSDETVEQARTLHDSGLGYKRVAAQLGIPKYTVRDWLNYRTRRS